jgi:hypothetical protein
MRNEVGKVGMRSTLREHKAFDVEQLQLLHVLARAFVRLLDE